MELLKLNQNVYRLQVLPFNLIVSCKFNLLSNGSFCNQTLSLRIYRLLVIIGIVHIL